MTLQTIKANYAAYLNSYIVNWRARNDNYEKSLKYYEHLANELFMLKEKRYLHDVYLWLLFARSDGAKALVYVDQVGRINNQN